MEMNFGAIDYFQGIPKKLPYSPYFCSSPL
nr:MAG TPA: hypothetical protein [Caudoviricetes sp.]